MILLSLEVKGGSQDTLKYFHFFVSTECKENVALTSLKKKNKIKAEAIFINWISQHRNKDVKYVQLVLVQRSYTETTRFQ